MQILPISIGHITVVCLALLLYVMTNRSQPLHRSSGSAVAWVFLLIALPYLGVPLYLIFGLRKVNKAMPAGLRQAQARAQALAAQEQVRLMPEWADKVLAAMQVPPAVRADTLRLEPDGHLALLGVLEFIERAHEQLLVCTFILGNDEVAQRIMDALLIAADRGVQVCVIVDAVGSLPLRRSNMLRLQRAGVQLRRFMPLLHNSVKGRINLRNHRKYMVADGQHIWCGGRNFAMEYFLDGHQAAWLDVSFQASGPIATQFKNQFESDWMQASAPLLLLSSQRISSEHVTQAAIEAFYRLQATWQHLSATLHATRATPQASGPHPDMAFPMEPMLSDQTVQMVASGPDHADDTIYTLLVTAIFQARERIVIVTPYFVPDDTLASALTLAARRGVHVQVLLPETSNHRLADLARMRALRQMADAGAQTYWINGMCHAKLVIVDSALALCGSANLDTRSLFLNFEVMTAFYSPEAIAALNRWAEHVRSRSQSAQLQPPSFRRDLLEGLVRAIAFEL